MYQSGASEPIMRRATLELGPPRTLHTLVFRLILGPHKIWSSESMPLCCSLDQIRGGFCEVPGNWGHPAQSPPAHPALSLAVAFHSSVSAPLAAWGFKGRMGVRGQSGGSRSEWGFKGGVGVQRRSENPSCQHPNPHPDPAGLGNENHLGHFSESDSHTLAGTVWGI